MFDFKGGSTGGRDVEEPYDRFEDITDLANNGEGMSDAEMMVVLNGWPCGNRHKIYESIVKKYQSGDGRDVRIDEPGRGYREILSRLMKFPETATEK